MTARRPASAQQKLVHVRFPVAGNVYSRAVTFLYGTPEQINAALKREAPKDEPFSPLRPGVTGHWRVVDHPDGETDYICLAAGRGAIYEMSCLSHEVLHHVAYTFAKIGLPLTNESEEAYCYYLAWLVRQCLHAIKGEVHAT